MNGDLFNPTEEHRMLRELVAEFTRNEVEPQAAASDAKGVLNVPLFRKMGELGLLGVTVPTHDGGAGMDGVAAVIVHHELSRSGKPWHRIERLQHIVGWFDRFLQGKTDVTNSRQ